MAGQGGGILVTGARGRIGATLADHWRDRSTVLLDREDGDLTVPDAPWSDRFAGIETVVHLAADPDPFAGFERNAADGIVATLNVLRACSVHGVRRVVYASSIWADWEPWQLADRMTWYAASKIAGEALVRAWTAEHGRPAICLRFGWFDATAPDDTAEQVRRVSRAVLTAQVDAAVAFTEPRCVVRYVTGRTDAMPDARPAS